MGVRCSEEKVSSRVVDYVVEEKREGEREEKFVYSRCIITSLRPKVMG